MGFLKKGYYFTLDVSVAVVALVIGLVIVLGNVVQQPVETPQFTTANDVMNVLARVENPSEAIPSYFQHVGEDVTYNNGNGVRSFSNNYFSDSILPDQFNMRIYVDTGINELMVYEIINTAIPEHESDVVLTSRKILYAQKDSWGPYIMEARVWR